MYTLIPVELSTSSLYMHGRYLQAAVQMHNFTVTTLNLFLKHYKVLVLNFELSMA